VCTRSSNRALACGPSTSPLGDALDALVDTLILTLLLLAPCAVLTAAGVLVWRRWRSVATAMIALGFAATFLSLASSLFVAHKTHAVLLEMTSAPQAQQDTFFIVAHYRHLPLLGILGIWAAALGTLWHVRRQR
jgi:hypothetical protein